MTNIGAIIGREVLDSRGNPYCGSGSSSGERRYGTSHRPSGASTGEHEAVELRDGDTARFLGKGVLKAVENAQREIADALAKLGRPRSGALDQKMIESMAPRPRLVWEQTQFLRSPWPRPAQLPRSLFAALPLSRRRRRQYFAHAHDEHPQRRRRTPTTMSTSRNHGDCRWGAPSFLKHWRWGVEVFPYTQGSAWKTRL